MIIWLDAQLNIFSMPTTGHAPASFEVACLPLYRAKPAGTLTLLLAHYMRTGMLVACAQAALGASRKWS